MKTISLEKALAKIEELEKENKELKKELEEIKSRKTSGRQKHNEKWLTIYKEVFEMYNSGLSTKEIANAKGLSERTVYRYKSYIDKIKETMGEQQ